MQRLGPHATAADLIQEILEQIEADTHRAFLAVDADGAIAAARASDQRRLADHMLGPLDGVAVALKDNIDTAGVPTTLGSRLFADRVPAADAEIVGRLKSAGAVIVGKTNLTELACGTVGTNPWSGDTLNPHDVTRYPGGSSSGSAAAVAAGLVRVAIGTDTACSIRQPAAMCGVVGFKPSFGRVSGVGVGVNARSLDHVGPLTSSVEDAAMALGAMQREGLPDPTALLDAPTSPLRVGVLTGEFVEESRPDVRAAFDTAVTLVRDLAARGLVGSVDSLDLGLDLSAIDDHANNLGADLFEHYGEAIKAAETGMVGDELRSWLDHYDGLRSTVYDEALAVQRKTAARIDDAMADYDVVLCPTTRTGAGLVVEAHTEPRDLRILNCSVWSVTGQPSLSLPFGRCDAGLPLGLLITGHRSRDDVVLQIARLLERHRSVEEPARNR